MHAARVAVSFVWGFCVRHRETLRHARVLRVWVETGLGFSTDAEPEKCSPRHSPPCVHSAVTCLVLRGHGRDGTLMSAEDDVTSFAATLPDWITALGIVCSSIVAIVVRVLSLPFF